MRLPLTMMKTTGVRITISAQRRFTKDFDPRGFFRQNESLMRLKNRAEASHAIANRTVHFRFFSIFLNFFLIESGSRVSRLKIRRQNYFRIWSREKINYVIKYRRRMKTTQRKLKMTCYTIRLYPHLPREDATYISHLENIKKTKKGK